MDATGAGRGLFDRFTGLLQALRPNLQVQPGENATPAEGPNGTGYTDATAAAAALQAAGHMHPPGTAALGGAPPMDVPASLNSLAWQHQAPLTDGVGGYLDPAAAAPSMAVSNHTDLGAGAAKLLEMNPTAHPLSPPAPAAPPDTHEPFASPAHVAATDAAADLELSPRLQLPNSSQQQMQVQVQLQDMSCVVSAPNNSPGLQHPHHGNQQQVIGTDHDQPSSQQLSTFSGCSPDNEEQKRLLLQYEISKWRSQSGEAPGDTSSSPAAGALQRSPDLLPFGPLGASSAAGKPKQPAGRPGLSTPEPFRSWDGFQGAVIAGGGSGPGGSGPNPVTTQDTSPEQGSPMASGFGSPSLLAAAQHIAHALSPAPLPCTGPPPQQQLQQDAATPHVHMPRLGTPHPHTGGSGAGGGGAGGESEGRVTRYMSFTTGRASGGSSGASSVQGHPADLAGGCSSPLQSAGGAMASPRLLGTPMGAPPSFQAAPPSHAAARSRRSSIGEMSPASVSLLPISSPLQPLHSPPRAPLQQQLGDQELVFGGSGGAPHHHLLHSSSSPAADLGAAGPSSVIAAALAEAGGSPGSPLLGLISSSDDQLPMPGVNISPGRMHTLLEEPDGAPMLLLEPAKGSWGTAAPDGAQNTPQQLQPVFQTHQMPTDAAAAAAMAVAGEEGDLVRQLQLGGGMYGDLAPAPLLPMSPTGTAAAGGPNRPTSSPSLSQAAVSPDGGIAQVSQPAASDPGVTLLSPGVAAGLVPPAGSSPYRAAPAAGTLQQLATLPLAGPARPGAAAAGAGGAPAVVEVRSVCSDTVLVTDSHVEEAPMELAAAAAGTGLETSERGGSPEAAGVKRKLDSLLPDGPPDACQDADPPPAAGAARAAARSGSDGGHMLETAVQEHGLLQQQVPGGGYQGRDTREGGGLQQTVGVCTSSSKRQRTQTAFGSSSSSWEGWVTPGTADVDEGLHAQATVPPGDERLQAAPWDQLWTSQREQLQPEVMEGTPVAAAGQHLQLGQCLEEEGYLGVVERGLGRREGVAEGAAGAAAAEAPDESARPAAAATAAGSLQLMHHVGGYAGLELAPGVAGMQLQEGPGAAARPHMMPAAALTGATAAASAAEDQGMPMRQTTASKQGAWLGLEAPGPGVGPLLSAGAGQAGHGDGVLPPTFSSSKSVMAELPLAAYAVVPAAAAGGGGDQSAPGDHPHSGTLEPVGAAPARAGQPWDLVVASWFREGSVARRDAALTRLMSGKQCGGHDWKPELLELLRHRRGM